MHTQFLNDSILHVNLTLEHKPGVMATPAKKQNVATLLYALKATSPSMYAPSEGCGASLVLFVFLFFSVILVLGPAHPRFVLLYYVSITVSFGARGLRAEYVVCCFSIPIV